MTRGEAEAGGLRILLADDEPDIRLVARVCLERAGGHAVVVAADGREALALAAAEDFDLVVLDMMMPGMDGLATLRALRALPGLENVPVVFLTAKVQRSELERYEVAGAAGVIMKPFDPLTLPAQLDRLLGRGHGAGPGVPSA